MPTPAAPSQLQVPNTYLLDDFMSGKGLLGPVCETGPEDENELFVSGWCQRSRDSVAGKGRKSSQSGCTRMSKGAATQRKEIWPAGRAPRYQAFGPRQGFGFHSKGPGKPPKALL